MKKSRNKSVFIVFLLVTIIMSCNDKKEENSLSVDNNSDLVTRSLKYQAEEIAVISAFYDLEPTKTRDILKDYMIVRLAEADKSMSNSDESTNNSYSNFLTDPEYVNSVLIKLADKYSVEKKTIGGIVYKFTLDCKTSHY